MFFKIKRINKLIFLLFLVLSSWCLTAPTVWRMSAHVVWLYEEVLTSRRVAPVISGRAISRCQTRRRIC